MQLICSSARTATSTRQKRIYVGRYLRARRFAISATLSLSESRAFFAQRAVSRLAGRRPNGLCSSAYALRGESHRLVVLLARVYRAAKKVSKKRLRRKAQLKRIRALLRGLVPRKLASATLRSLHPTLRANYLAARAVSKII